MINLANGMRNIFSESIVASHQANAGLNQFTGPMVEMPESLKNSLKPDIEKFAKIYRETGIELIKQRVINVNSKSKLKKIFNVKTYIAKYNAETYLDYELYLYCRDLHAAMDYARYTM